MCIIGFGDEYSIPTEEELINCCVNNPDGFGYSILSNGKIITKRTMNADDAISSFMKDVTSGFTGYWLFHARIASHGYIDLERCHPFTVRHDIVLAHNGMLPYTGLPKGVSDTQYLARNILSDDNLLRSLDSSFDLWDKYFTTTHNKVVILNAGNELESPYYIFNVNGGVEDNGIWWSNYGFEDVAKYTARYIKYNWKDDDCALAVYDKKEEEDDDFDWVFNDKGLA